MQMITAASVPIQWKSDLSIYASEPFLRAVGDEYGWLGGFDESGALRCVLPYTIVKKLFLRMVRFRVETMYIGDRLSGEEERGFLNSAMDYFHDAGAGLVIPASTNTLFRTYPDGGDAVPYGSYVVDLTQPEERLWNDTSSGHRRNIRRAMKDSVRIRSAPEKIEDVHALVRDTFRRASLPFMDLGAFRKFVAGLGENVRIMVAERDGELQGGIVLPFSDYGAYYVYGGSIPEPRRGAMHLLHWEAMRYFRDLGVRRYDFVGARIDPDPGSKQEGLSAFKKRFGGQLLRGYLWKYPLRRLPYLLYGLGSRVRSGGDIVDQERHKVDGGTRAIYVSPSDARAGIQSGNA